MLAMAKPFEKVLTIVDCSCLELAIKYHDIVYEPGAGDNEERSIEVMLADHRAHRDRDPIRGMPEFMVETIKGLIMATKAPFEPKTELQKLMVYIDWSHFASDDRQKLNAVNHSIFREFQKYPYSQYVIGRDAFFETATSVPPKLVGDYVTQEMADKLIEGIRLSKELSLGFRPKIGIYMGSFNPFHQGHAHIVKKAETILDKVIIVQALNPGKNANQAPLPVWYQRYYQTVRSTGYKSAKEIIDGIKSEDPDCDFVLIRGIRNNADLAAEQTYMRILKDMGVDIPVQHILCDAEFQHISSSAVRELASVGVDLYKV
jgi:cytidyltransferase-like protein